MKNWIHIWYYLNGIKLFSRNILQWDLILPVLNSEKKSSIRKQTNVWPECLLKTLNSSSLSWLCKLIGKAVNILSLKLSKTKSTLWHGFLECTVAWCHKVQSLPRSWYWWMCSNIMSEQKRSDQWLFHPHKWSFLNSHTYITQKFPSSNSFILIHKWA